MRGSVSALPRPETDANKKPKGLGGEYQVAGANRRWRCPFRCRGSRHESAVAQLFSLGGYTLMKTHTLRLALALGLLVCRGRTATAQQVSTSAPIIIRLSEIDRYAVSEWSLPKAMDGARLGLLYRDKKQSEVDTLIRDGTILNRSVWVMDGERVIAKCSLIGEFISEAKYGLCLGFDSAEDAQKVGAIVKLERSADELMRQHKSQLDYERLWIF
jgi:hypothetical protein